MEIAETGSPAPSIKMGILKVAVANTWALKRTVDKAKTIFFITHLHTMVENLKAFIIRVTAYIKCMF
jgi:hypothetical protein